MEPCDLWWAVFRFTEQINEFQHSPVSEGIYGSPAPRLGSLLSLIQALQFQNELLNHFFIMNEAPSPWLRHTTHPPPPILIPWESTGKRDLKEERGINANYGTRRTLSNPKQSTEGANKAAKLKGNYVKLRKMRPCLLTRHRLESPNNGVALCSQADIPLITAEVGTD